VVTTTWGAWKSQHPLTTVLSLDTGHRRDYGDGVAYNEYFATDALMFPVPLDDNRLKNKDEVLIVRTPKYDEDPTAIAIKYLKKKSWKQLQIGGTNVVVYANKDGSARAYAAGNQKFTKVNNGKLIDKQGREWTPYESELVSEDGVQLGRLPSHNIFWFAWYNTYPKTRLIK